MKKKLRRFLKTKQIAPPIVSAKCQCSTTTTTNVLNTAQRFFEKNFKTSTTTAYVSFAQGNSL